MNIIITHHIHQHQHHLAWDNSIPPVATINSGEIVTFDSFDTSNDQVNGPIFVRDAQPGDVLEVEIIDIKIAKWGWTGIIPGFRLLHDEVCGTAIETPVVVSVRLTVIRDESVKHVISPLLDIANDMLEATKQVIRQMINYLVQNKGLTKEEAYMLCFIAVDIRATQVVDMPNYTVGAFLPLDIFTYADAILILF
ncbi:hypothetical protein I4U23_003725 [Adineta vaga]|nr:hypothetical protein I4U23_003725 [Adineta vaga]